jgi:D-3-phosphoglycerate dehydrogenase
MTKLSLAKNKIKVLLLEGVHESAVSAFITQGYNNIEYIKNSLAEVDLIERIADAHIIGIRSRTQLTDNVLNHAHKLMAIGCFCIGTNQVELSAAQNRGVAVFNAPFSNTRSVAELVIGEIILLLRGIPQKNALAHRGIWQKSAVGSVETRGKILGIIGYGHIGTQLGLLAETLGMRVVYYDIEAKLPLGNATQVASLPQLYQQADVISLHVPETEFTQYMISQEEFEQMNDGVMIINASRGSIIDINSLAVALNNGKVAGAAIDVFPIEPKGNDDEFISILRQFDNVILTPHIGGSTIEAQENIGQEVANKLVKYSDKGTSVSAVNFPEISLPERTVASANGLSRILHIHHNQLGIMNNINQLLAQLKVNVAGQFLQTNEKIGYVVIDIEAPRSDEILEALKQVKGTIKARVLY